MKSESSKRLLTPRALVVACAPSGEREYNLVNQCPLVRFVAMNLSLVPETEAETAFIADYPSSSKLC